MSDLDKYQAALQAPKSLIAAEKESLKRAQPVPNRSPDQAGR
jgi:hypothetical protein